MTRRCSHCSNNGHNSRTCPNRGGGGGGGGGGGVGGGGGGGGVGGSGGGLRLFGVRLTDGSMIKKSASMGNLSSAHYHSSSSAAASPNNNQHDSPSSDPHVHVSDGYLSDDPTHASCSANRRGDRKKGARPSLTYGISSTMITHIYIYIYIYSSTYVLMGCGTQRDHNHYFLVFTFLFKK